MSWMKRGQGGAPPPPGPDQPPYSASQVTAHLGYILPDTDVNNDVVQSVTSTKSYRMLDKLGNKHCC